MNTFSEKKNPISNIIVHVEIRAPQCTTITRDVQYYLHVTVQTVLVNLCFFRISSSSNLQGKNKTKNRFLKFELTAREQNHTNMATIISKIC